MIEWAATLLSAVMLAARSTSSHHPSGPVPPLRLTTLLNAISDAPDDPDRWIALACWLGNNGKDDESNVVRLLWPTLRDNLAYASLAATLADVARNAKVLAAIAREVERPADETPPG